MKKLKNLKSLIAGFIINKLGGITVSQVDAIEIKHKEDIAKVESECKDLFKSISGDDVTVINGDYNSIARKIECETLIVIGSNNIVPVSYSQVIISPLGKRNTFTNITAIAH